MYLYSKMYLYSICLIVLCLLLTFSFAGCALSAYACEIVESESVDIFTERMHTDNRTVHIGVTDFNVRYLSSSKSNLKNGISDIYGIVDGDSVSEISHIRTDSATDAVIGFMNVNPYPAIDKIDLLSDTELKETVEAMMGDLVDFTQYNVFKLKRPHSSNSYYRLVWQVRRELLCNIFVEVRITSGGLIMSFDKADDCPDDLTRSFVNTSRRDELIRDKIKSHLGVDSIEEVEYDIVSEVLGYYNNVPAVMYTLDVVDADGFAHVILFAIHRTQ